LRNRVGMFIGTPPEGPSIVVVFVTTPAGLLPP